MQKSLVAFALHTHAVPTKPLTSKQRIISDSDVWDKLHALGMPVGDQDQFKPAELTRGVCSWRELTGNKATRAALTDAEREAIAATPSDTAFSLPRSIRNVPLSVNMVCQTGLLKQPGKPLKVIPVSTGKYGGSTKTGMFSIYWRYPGNWQSSATFPNADHRPNMYKPLYFLRDLAVHGSREQITGRPQSHGCVRTQISDQVLIAKTMHTGSRIWIYGSYWTGKVKPFGGKV